MLTSISQLDQWLWVIPGICFLFSYNRLRDVEAVEFSGWPFLFFIILIGALTYLPLRLYFNLPLVALLVSSLIGFLIPFIIKLIFMPFVSYLEENPNFFTSSNLWSIVYFFYPLENRDKFIKNCIDFEGSAIFITIKDPVIIKEGEKHTTIPSRVFLGFLVEFPYLAIQDTSSQVIRILPLLSGYRYIDGKENKDEKGNPQIIWLKKYEIHEDSTGIIIPRDKIIHLSRYDEATHSDLIFPTKNKN